MKVTPGRRLIGIFLLLGCLFGLLVWFGSLAPAPAVGAYPDDTNLGTNYDAWVGEKASLTGEVVETDPLTIVAEYSAGERIRLRVTGTDLQPAPGDRLTVFGVVKPDRTLHVQTAYIVPSSGYTYMYTVSFIAGLWVLGRLVRTWRIDRQTWSLEPRSTPLDRRTDPV